MSYESGRIRLYKAEGNGIKPKRKIELTQRDHVKMRFSLKDRRICVYCSVPVIKGRKKILYCFVANWPCGRLHSVAS